MSYSHSGPWPVLQVPQEVRDAVNALEAEAKPKRARTKAGTFQADDKATPDVNEAFDPAQEAS